jgi:hypothetical protein
MAISKWRVGRALRLLNRGLTLYLCSFQSFLPNLNQWPTDVPTHKKFWHATTALNFVLVYFLLKMLGHAVWIALYAFKAFCICQLTGAILVPPEAKWKLHVRNAAISGLFAYTIGIVWYRGGQVSIPSVVRFDLNMAKLGGEL